jgi:hypothetical protein
VKKQMKCGLVFGAAVLFGLTAALSQAEARRGGGHVSRGHVSSVHRNVGSVHRNVNVHHRNVNVNRHVRRAVVGGAVVGHRYHGGVYYGHVRRYWHGQWWAYGVGSCWRLTPDGYYVWVCF